MHGDSKLIVSGPFGFAAPQACLILAGFQAIRERQNLYCYDGR
jgi:hypothetical protein